MADLTLLHLTWRGNRTMLFYSGQRPVRKGIITIPHNHPEWVRRAWLQGYRIDPESMQKLTLDEARARNLGEAEPTVEELLAEEHELLALVDAITEEANDEEPVVEEPVVEESVVVEAPKPKRGRPKKSTQSTESAESEEVNVEESSDGGRQPADEDGVRES